jgi:hypothetical protein
MNLARRMTAVALAATLSASAGATTLDFIHAPQEHSNWCWLAATQNLLAYHGTRKSQCELAAMAFNRVDTCGNTEFNWNHPANKAGALYGSDTGVDKFLMELAGRTTTGSRGAMDWNGVKAKIDRQLPLAALWEWKVAFPAHVLTIYGYVEEDGTRSVNYSDPFPGEGKKLATYDWFKQGGTGNQAHFWSYTLEVD